MKILQFINTLQTGGAENIVKDYCLSLSKNNEVLVVTVFNSKGYKNYEILSDSGIKIINLNKMSRIKTFFRMILWKLFGNFTSSLKFKKVLKEFNPDIIHCHLYAVNIASRCIKLLKNKKVFLTIHNEPRIYFEKGSKVIKSINKLTKKTNFKMIAIHDKMKNEIKNKYCYNNVFRIYNPVGLEFYNCKITKEEARKILGLQKNSFIIGNIGRFSYQKNHTKIISVFKEALKINSNCHLLLVGEGELKIKIIDQLKNEGLFNKCTILENRNDVNLLLRSMDVFLFPSLYEGLGIALLEAQAIGLPCLASSSIPSEAFVNNNCIPIDINTDDSILAKRLFTSFENGQNNKIEDFNINKVISDLVSLYKNDF